MTSFLPPGTAAPGFDLTAVATQRRISPTAVQPTPLLLIFLEPNTATQVPNIVKTIRKRYIDHTELAVASIVDLHIVPRLLRGAVEGFMRSAFDQARREIPAGLDPADHLVILPDWRGDVTRAYRVPPTGREVALVLLDGHGRVHATYQGDAAGATAVTLVANLLQR